jgi:hypothetical protein
VTKEEEIKWKQVIKDLEVKFEADIERAKELSKVKELNEERQRLEYEMKLALQKAHDIASYEKEKLIFEYETKLESCKTKYELEKTEALLKLEVQLTKDLELKWSEKMNEASKKATHEEGLVWQIKLSNEKDKIESMKNDFSKQIQRAAEERMVLQDLFNNSEKVLYRFINLYSKGLHIPMII